MSEKHIRWRDYFHVYVPGKVAEQQCHQVYPEDGGNFYRFGGGDSWIEETVETKGQGKLGQDALRK